MNNTLKYLALAVMLQTTSAGAAPKTWTSIVVYDNGTMNLHEGIKIEKTCREALCFIQWSKNCADRAKDLEEERRQAAIREALRKEEEAKYRAEHPCVVNPDGSKRCPTKCGYETRDKDDKLIGGSLCMGAGDAYMVAMTGDRRYIKVAACFQP